MGLENVQGKYFLQSSKMIRRFTYFIIVALLLVGCSGVKRSETSLNKGNYDNAIRISINKLRNTNNKKIRKKHIGILEEAFEKAVYRDQKRIDLLEQQNYPENTRDIYEGFVQLQNRQALIENLLPLRGASFNIVDYSDEIASAKSKYSDYLYEKGNQLLALGTILDARSAHDHYSRLKQLQPDKESLDSLLREAHYQGTDFVTVKIENRTEQVIPKRLEKAMLDFDSYKLDDFWTEYHDSAQENVDYTFGIILEFKEIRVSPESIFEKEFDRETRVKDGWQYVLDENGNVAKDSLGNDIKVDVYKNLRAKVIVSSQNKAAQLNGNIIYQNVKQTRNMKVYPITSQFEFKHIFATFEGDEGALTERDVELARRAFVPFPSNEQMIFDTSTDLKQKFARILRRNKLR